MSIGHFDGRIDVTGERLLRFGARGLWGSAEAEKISISEAFEKAFEE